MMEVARINIPVLDLLVLGWILMGCINFGVMDADAAPYAPAMFVFGDSLADMGNNNFIPGCTVRANFTPYGISAFLQPTGRFSNGLITFDYVASTLGLQSPHPFLLKGTSFSSGINFASAGSGLFDSTGEQENVMPLSEQIQKFQAISSMFIKQQGSKHPHGAEEAKTLIAKSLFCISTGSNDIAKVFERTPSSPAVAPFTPSLLPEIDKYLVELYNSGARKFLLVDVPALGCTPYARHYMGGPCFPPANLLSIDYNRQLRKLVDRLNQNLDGASIILLNSFSYLMHMIENGKLYGFSETETACCGSGKFNVDVLCGETTPRATYCKDPDKYLFWDYAHPTQKAAYIFANATWSGDPSVIHPFNLSTLVLARK